MNQKYQQQSISIFYSIDYWNSLLRECILPLFKEIQINDTSLFYIILFSQKQGDHIDLILAKQKEISPKIIAKLISRVSCHLNQKPSVPKARVNIKEEIFMDFPNNRLFRNLRGPLMPVDINGKVYDWFLELNISKFIILGFSHTVVNSKKLFSFCLCMEYCLLKVYANDKNITSIIDYLLLELPPITQKEHFNIDERLNNFSKANNLVINQSFSDNYFQTNWNHMDWKKCEGFCSEYVLNQDLSLFVQSFKKYTSVLYTLLGISDRLFTRIILMFLRNFMRKSHKQIC